ncbi:MAG TPA: class E sortase [Acidimicrobiales bacterium]|nr:class E sortase [Acidimicrobiales bacterium]
MTSPLVRSGTPGPEADGGESRPGADGPEDNGPARPAPRIQKTTARHRDVLAPVRRLFESPERAAEKRRRAAGTPTWLESPPPAPGPAPSRWWWRWRKGAAKTGLPGPASAEFRSTAKESSARLERSDRIRLRTEAIGASLARVVPHRTPKETTKEKEASAEHTVLIVGLAASAVGLCLLLFVAYLFVFTGLQQRRAQHLLLNEFTSTSGGALLSGKVPPEGEPTAVLTIPAIHLDQVVVQGASSSDLVKGPGVMIGTARPGTAGNSVIAGHRLIDGGPFSRIDQLRRGDRITLVTGLGKFRYQVVSSGTTSAGSLDPVAPSNEARLTLVTSNPPFLATGRYYVRADLRSQPATGPKTKGFPAVDQRGLSGDPAAVGSAFWTGVLLALGFAVTIGAYRRYRDRMWTVYLLTTPTLLALALLWYQNLTRLLPATM